MRPEREIDSRVAQEIFGHEVFAKDENFHESTEAGIRPLRNYSSDMGAAWLVAEKMRISLIPIEGGSWFAFVGGENGWANPESFLEYLRSGDFSQCGASVGPNPAQAICEAALVANQKQKLQNPAEPLLTVVPDADAEDPQSLH